MIYVSDISQLNCTDLEKMVCEERIKYASKYKFEIDRRRSLAVEALLNYALKEEGYGGSFPVRIAHRDNWAPYFLDDVKIPGNSETFFSLSHSGNFVAVALGENPIGIDIEEIKSHKEALEERFFSENERKLIESDTEGKEAGFFRIWTLKEAFLKVTGEGLKYGIEGVCVEADDISKGKYRYNSREYRGLNLPAPYGYSMSVCCLIKNNEHELTKYEGIYNAVDLQLH